MTATIFGPYPAATAAQAKDTTDTTHLLTPNNQIDIGMGRLLWQLLNADFNITTDQAFTKVGVFGNWMIGANGSIRLTNSSGNLATAAGGIYTAASKGGIGIVAGATTYSGVNVASAGTGVSAAIVGLTELSATALFLSLTTGAGTAQTANLRIFGHVLS